MNLYALFTLTCGLSLFLYGMYRSEKALKLLAGARTRQIIESITRNRFLSMLVGLVLTFGTQSSSATTVMLVGLSTAGLITLAQSMGVILGTAVGTTITVQLFAWKITRIAPVLITVGYFMYAMFRGTRRMRVGQLLLGFGLVFFGMTIMAGAVAPLRSSEVFATVLKALNSPFALLFISAVFTAIVQSSAATIALVISLATVVDGTTALGLAGAVPLILGANIGTSATAIIASLNASVPGKQVAWAHAIYKTLAALVALPLVPLLVRFGEWSSPSAAAQIANVHTLFNCAAALVFLPLTGPLAALVQKLIKAPADQDGPYHVRFIDRDFSDHPYLALAQANKEIVRMSGLVTSMYESIWCALVERNAEQPAQIRLEDDKVDYLHEHISPYLTRLSEEEMRAEESSRQIQLLSVASELELVADVLSKDVCGSIQQLVSKNLSFSNEGLDDLEEFYQRVRVNLYAATDAVAAADRSIAERVVADRAQVDDLQDQLRTRHFERLKAGLPESLETTTIHLDLMEDLRRVNSHACRICMSVLEGRFVTSVKDSPR